MKFLIVLAAALSLAGCASMQQKFERPVAHVVPPVHHAAKPAAPVVAPPPVVTAVPATPIPPGAFKLRWNALKDSAHKIHFFHQKH